jgi:predicted Zn-dependent protease
MIIVHESQPVAAAHIKTVLKRTFHVPVQLTEQCVPEVFTATPNGHLYSAERAEQFFHARFPDAAVLLVTGRNIFLSSDIKDDFAIGFSHGTHAVVSTARLRRGISYTKHVSREQYLRRLAKVAVHEIGHGVVDGNHLQETTWVDMHASYRLDMGWHCADNTCVMYEFTDVQAPPVSAGHLLVGRTKRYDSGLDDQLRRMRSDWFCTDCKASINVTAPYRRT